MKLLLIDNRVPDIETIIGSVNESTACVVFNYYHDTRDTLLSKVKFLNRRNRVIRDNFYYETPPVPVITDLSSCHLCDASGNPKMYTTSADIAMQALEYAALNGNATDSDATTSTSTLPPTPWITASVQSSGPAPVFFQRIRPVMDGSGSTVLYPEQLPILVSELDEIYDIFKTIPYEADPDNAVGGYTAFTTVGIIQHVYVMNGSDTYTFLKMLNPGTATLKNVITDDPTLQTWEPFISTISAILTRHQTTILDLMACALYADPNWKYVIDELQTRMAVNIRASLDNTGASLMGGNWILESDSANLKDVYFTDAIDGWNHLLATITDSRFYALRWNDSMYSTRSYDSRLKIAAGTSNFTIETWYYETTASYNCTIVDMGDYNYTFQIRNLNTAGAVGMSLYNNGNGWWYAESAVVPVAQWSHIALTRSGSTLTFYINGVERQTFTTTVNMYSNNSTFAIGWQSPDSCQCNRMKNDTVLYDIRLWNVARTATQIQMYRNRIVPANTSGLVANYLCTDNTSALNDRTSNALHTTIQNYNSARWSNTAVTVPNIGFYISNSYSLTATNATNYGDLTFTDFSGVNFAGVNFTGTNLSGSNFTNCNFTGATLSSITVTAATDFTGADFTNITSSNVTGTPILPSGYNISGGAIVQALPAPTLGTFASIPTKTFGTDVSFNLTDPTSNSTGAFTYSSSNTSVATISSRTVTIVGVGTSTITATQASDGTYRSASVSTTLTVNAALPTFGPFTLGPKSGVYVLADASFSLTAPTSNSAGAFSYTSDNSGVAAVVYGSSYASTLYSINNPSIPTLSLTNFPVLGAMPTWEMNIRFNVTSGSNSWRALIGDMYNPVNSSRGWGVWVSSSNSIHFSWANVVWEPSFTVALNTNYILKITRVPTSLTLLLTNVATSGTQTATNTAMVDTNTYFMSVNGPVTIGGWISYGGEIFPGTISYITVVNPNNQTSTYTTTNLLARYDASVAGAYTVSGSNVTQWNDLTGNGYHLTNNGTGPTTTTINSVTALNFNSGYGLTCASAPLVTAITLFMVARYNSAIGGWGNFMHHGSRDYDWSLERNGSTSNVQFQSDGDNTNAQIAAVDGTNYLWVCRIVGSTRQFWMYSDTLRPIYSSATGVAITAGNASIYVGKSSIGEACNSSIGEILYYNASLSDADVSSNILYLQNKWLYTRYVAASLISPYISLVSNGTSNITATQDACGNYLTKSVSSTLTVGQVEVAPTFGSFVVPSSKTYGDASFAIITRPTSNSSGAITYSSSNTSIATIDASGNWINIVSAGDVSFNASQAAVAGQFTSGSVTSNTLTISLATPTLSSSTFTVASSKTYGDASFAITTRPTSNSNGGITYSSSNTSVATIDASGNFINLVAAGSVTFTATQAATSQYTSATKTSNSLTVALATPTLSSSTFTVASSKTYGDASFAITTLPTSNSSGAITYTSSDTSVATIDASGNFINLVAAGSVTFTATQAATSQYTSATKTSNSLTVALATPTLSSSTFTVASSKTYGDASFAITTLPTSNSSGAITYTSSDTSVATIDASGNFINLVAAGSVTFTATQAATSQYTSATKTSNSLTVALATPTLSSSTFTVASSKTYGDASFAITTLPTSNSSGAITYTSSDTSVATIDASGNFINLVAAGSVTFTATQAATSQYSSATKTSNSLTVSVGTPTLSSSTFTVASSKSYGDASFAITTRPTSNSDGVITYTSSDTSVATIDASGNWITLVGAGDVSFNATQAAVAGKFTSATKTSNSLTVALATPTLSSSTFTVASSKSYGDASFAITTRPTSNSDGVITYTSSDTSVATIDASGNFITIIGLGDVSFNATQAAVSGKFTSATKTSNTLTVNKIIPTLSFVSPPTTKNVLDTSFSVVATSASPGAVTYSSSSSSLATIDSVTGVVTLKGAGTVTLTASQAETSIYSSPTNATCSIVISSVGTALEGQTITSGTTYSGLDFSGASLVGTTVSGVSFSGANLSNVDFSGAVITGTDFSNTNISGAVNLPDFSLVQKLQLLKNINNAGINEVQVTTPVSGSVINTLLDAPQDLVAGATFIVKAPTTVDASANKVLNISSVDVSGNQSVYVPLNSNETIKINEGTYSFDGTRLLDTSGKSIKYLSAGGSIFKIYVGSVVLVNIQTAMNNLKFSDNGLYQIVSSLFQLKST